MEREPTASEVWRAVVVHKMRSKFQMFALALMLGVAVWQFVVGDIRTGLIVLAVVVVNYVGIPAAAIFGGMFFARRRDPRKE